MDKTQQVHEAVLNDPLFQRLCDEKARFYSSIPLSGAMKDGFFEMTPINEDEHPYLSTVNRAIEQRIDQIKSHYTQ